jgi:hypothetical protein
MNCSLVIAGQMWDRLHAHLFPGDGDEHGAVIIAGMAQTSKGIRLLARELFLAEDGIDYVAGKRGYRMLRGDFITPKILACRDEELCYLAIHNHGGTTRVDFSDVDLASHERGYPTLLQITRGQPVGGLVLARDAVAGDVWLASGHRLRIHETRILGPSIKCLYSRPPLHHTSIDDQYDRQARLFGEVGQYLLSQLKVGVIGAGGVGSLIIQLLVHLGVGHIIVVDPDRIDQTNRPRTVGSTPWDPLPWLTKINRPVWLQGIGRRLATKKVTIARRLAWFANPHCRVEPIFGDVVDDAVARRLASCDYLFLAADPMSPRLVFNALVHQYLIPGVQVGSKIPVHKATGKIGDVYSVSRPVTPDTGCLWCNGLISRERLHQETIHGAERAVQAYIDEETLIAPSVITLNAKGASQAVDDFLFAMVGLTRPEASQEYVRSLPRTRGICYEQPRKDQHCPDCGTKPSSRLAKGDALPLPTREAKHR